MKVFDNYSEYIREKKNYASWKDARNQLEAKRLAYVVKNSISPEQKKSDLRRADAILNSIDIMDEYSQARAEDMEVVTEQCKGVIIEIGTYLTMGIGALFALSKSVMSNLKELFTNKNMGKIPKLIIPALITIAPMMAGIIVSSAWGAGTETKASRLGRAEAINKVLYSPNQFAELTDEQEEQVKEISKTINYTHKDDKKARKTTKGFGIIKSFKTMFSHDEAEQYTIDYINYRIESDVHSFENHKFTEDEIKEANRDKQLIQNIVEKIDIASQDYAEDVELATGIVTTTALAGGFLTGFITNQILKKFPKTQSMSRMISFGVGLAIPLALAIISAKFQKQASRVGRYKVKQDFMNNPDKLIYVDDKDVMTEDGTPYLSNNKKDGFFKFLVNVVRDNREYNKYLKNEYIEAKKESMAREQIVLSKEQKERAIQLQTNTFKMFNKLDEKSQNLSESTEAIGEMIGGGITSIISLIGVGITTLSLALNPRQIQKPSKKNLIITYAPVVLSLLVASGLNIIITKEQKKASKVANMLAINELNDTKNFLNYDKYINRGA